MRRARALVDPAIRFTFALRVGAWLRTQPGLKPLELLVRLWTLRARYGSGC